jgi:uncharacterized protein
MKKETFIKSSELPAPIAEAFAWHARPGALDRLNPPWDPATVIRRSENIEVGARVVMKVKTGPVRSRWEAEHILYDPPNRFVDVQISGPFAHWEHNHIFTDSGQDRCTLRDQIEYALPVGKLGQIFGGSLVRRNLQRMFDYRHRTTINDLRLHRQFSDNGHCRFAISGASGVVGRQLTPFLTTGGHSVAKLVRRKPTTDSTDEIFWNPADLLIDQDKLEGTDVIIHLAGENIGEGKWTPEKKKVIVESRIKGTRLLAEAAAKMNPKPQAFICASAVGYYGDRGEDTLCETDSVGDLFISHVCSEWENAAQPAIDAGIRVVFLRIGVALSPLGGALARLLPMFKAGFGGKVGKGTQYVSWISIDDLIAGIHRACFDDKLSGAVNLVSPNPVTYGELTSTLGHVLGRPSIFTVPEFAVRAAFGEMGEEVLLASARVAPQKLNDIGHRFLFPKLENALRHQLGLTRIIREV